ncbi:cupin domain-containing protein [Deinococcus maricopensis]|uniref:Cupin 2 conserved barrel domain protein n=1 Tax=Deinococcus maricopensis (strain DSM 21211 / LMG 22137 / NRRL B-23946 / LB-34) TaxID=709986 RepID=E8UBL7_DEIML|nr:cupin domain-containing protein [Deinococcus maricopensis]ADV68456.1 Cupin 2 conserved barrel domain protein [Deinococcus maricopensis DSM 21211]
MISRASAEHYTWGGDCDGWHLVRTAALSVIQERMPPGRAEVRHAHGQARQFFFVLSGVLTLEVDGVVHVLGVQEGVEVPPGAAHQARNVSAGPVEFLVTSQPPAHGDRVVLAEPPSS